MPPLLRPAATLATIDIVAVSYDIIFKRLFSRDEAAKTLIYGLRYAVYGMFTLPLTFTLCC